MTTGELTKITLAGVEGFCVRHSLVYEFVHGRDENSRLIYMLRFLNDAAKVHQIMFIPKNYTSYLDACKDIFEELNKEFGPFLVGLDLAKT